MNFLWKKKWADVVDWEQNEGDRRVADVITWEEQQESDAYVLKLITENRMAHVGTGVNKSAHCKEEMNFGQNNEGEKCSCEEEQAWRGLTDIAGNF